jgi:hypothetical protein
MQDTQRLTPRHWRPRSRSRSADGCTAVLGSAPGGDFYQTFQLITSYLWGVARAWNLTEYFDKVSLPKLRRMDQIQKLHLCCEEDGPFPYPSTVSGIPEPDYRM